MAKQTSESELPGFPARVPDLKPGTYKDGRPLHEVEDAVGGFNRQIAHPDHLTRLMLELVGAQISFYRALAAG